MAPTRWGIVGAGKIANDFVNALSLLPNEKHQVMAVAARDLDRAQEFANNWNISKAYGSYKELTEDAGIDIYYISTIHPYHFELCKLFLGAGKNVLCEKPLTMNADQAKVLIDLAKEKDVFFQEGFWSRFFPVYHKVREAIASGEIGDVKVVQASFGIQGDFGTMQSGTLMGAGCYPVMLAQMIYQEFPQKIIATGTKSDLGYESAVFGTLHYSGGRIAQISSHDQVFLSNTAEIYGTKGSIQISTPMWAPESVTINGEKHDFPLPDVAKKMHYPNSQGFIYEADAIRDCLFKGEKENPLMTMDQSLDIMRIIDSINGQIGVVYK